MAEVLKSLCLSKEIKLEPVSFIDPEAIIDGDPQERAAIMVNDGKVFIGIWECAPYAEFFDTRSSHEMCCVVQGRCSLTEVEGKEEIFKAGDAFIVPKGFKGTFRVTETFRMYFMTATP